MRSKNKPYNHYFVEKKIAMRIKNSSRDERKILYKTMYQELFAEVPDHPRLTQAYSEKLTSFYNSTKFAIIERFINTNSIVLEFAPGDCSFAYALCKRVKRVIGVDISDQRFAFKNNVPSNFKFLLYDGFDLSSVEDESVNIVFSDQLVEHLHAEDVVSHFELASRILKPSGCYVFRTPHAYLGPHDISKYFSQVSEGFHIKEWTYSEMRNVVLSSGFSRIYYVWNKRQYVFNIPVVLVETLEVLLNKCRFKFILKLLLPNVTCVAYK